MARIKDVEKVKLFCGVLTASLDFIEDLCADLEKEFSQIDIKTSPINWDFTSYYQSQMGSDLKKFLFSFSDLITPDKLSDVKLKTNEIEKKYRSTVPGVDRPINLDPGYITLSSMVLASAKPFAHRIYLARGIYAQVDYIFHSKSGVEFMPWTYPDYKTKAYLDFFLEMRERLKLGLKEK